jgi:acyl-CoA synthetase (AMP-forming)/AMP-acid ligase II
VRLHQRVRRGDEGGLQTSLSPADHRRAAAGAEHLLGSIGKPAFETVIADYPGVTAVAVVGQPDEHWGEIVVAFVTASAGSVIEQEALRRFCRERLAAYKVPAVVTVIDAMPLNASGKILKRELRTRLPGAPPR